MDQRKKEEENRDRVLQEKWKLEDEERKIQRDLLLREKQKEREELIGNNDRETLERK